MIADRIRRARLLRGLTLDELAGQMGDLSKQALSKFEMGKSLPNAARLIQLAHALHVRPEFFFRKDEVLLAPLEFRKRARMGKARHQQLTEQIRDRLERYIALEHCFESERAVNDELALAAIQVASAEQAEHAAAQLRQRWNVGSGAIANVTELLEEHGIKVAALAGSGDFDGACVSAGDGAHAMIALNAARPGERIRFTAAHELGHWAMTLPDAMTQKSQQACCRRFAGAFLYPADCVRRDFGGQQRSRVHVRELFNAKKRYGISMAAIVRRLKDLELLNDAGYRGLVIQMNTKGWRKAEPGALPPEVSHRFETLVYRGLAQGLFSVSRAAEFLQQPVGAFDAKLSAWPCA